MKLWEKGIELDALIEQFTIGKDRELDRELAVYDVKGTMAHSRMLKEIGILTAPELRSILNLLTAILDEMESGNFQIPEQVEDIHSLIEDRLTRELGAVAKKVHTGRSRNDQVLVDLRMYYRDQLAAVREKTRKLAFSFLEKSDRHKEMLMPGYTHSQVAMVSSFGLWFGSFAEALVDDLEVIKCMQKLVNKNPLGSAAGYGSSIPLDRELTTRLLGFDQLCYNSIYAQFGRGKIEICVAEALANLAYTLGKFANDVCLFCNENFSFLKLPESITTGSSIMPHKKNPDVFELMRAKCRQLESLPMQLRMTVGNLMTGYHRDFQILKELLFPALASSTQILEICLHVLPMIEVQGHVLDEDKYQHVFSVEVVNDMVMNGIPFREAYQKVARQIATGEYKANKKIKHSHLGSIGNLGNHHIAKMLQKL